MSDTNETDTPPGPVTPARPLPESRPGSGGAVAFLAGGLAALSALCMFAARGIESPAVSVWHLPIIHPGSIYRMPLLTEWLAEAASFLPVESRTAVFMFFHLLTGALSCGVLAAIAASAVSWKATRWEALACGWGAGLIFAATMAWHSAATTCSPAVVTVFLTLLAFRVVLDPDKSLDSRGVVTASLLMGLASANDPAFGVLAFLLLVVSLGLAPPALSAVRLIFVYACGFAALACLPIVESLLRGETFAEFLSHALATPYPTVGDALPHMGYLPELLTELPLATLAVAPLGLVLLLRRDGRGAPLVWALVFLAMGPFLPSLTNHTTDPTVLNSSDGPQAMVLAAAVLFAVWGLTAILGTLLRRPGRGLLAVAAILVASGFLAANHWKHQRGSAGDAPLEIARAILADCPENAILVAGDARIYSLLCAAQTLGSAGSGVTLVPGDALEAGHSRERLRTEHLHAVVLNDDFPPADAEVRWYRERPLEMATLHANDRQLGEGFGLRALALWELTRDNFALRPVCFAGEQASWLTARAQQNGLVLVFPRQEESRSASLQYVKTLESEDRLESLDPETSEVLASLLLPVSEAARRQGDAAQASAVAALARKAAGSNPAVWLCSARAAARGGERETASSFVERYLMLRPDPDSAARLAVQEDLLRNALATDYANLMRSSVVSEPDPVLRSQLTAQLLSLDELSVLAEGFAAVRNRYEGMRDAQSRYVRIRGVQALCDGAAFLTQLGKLREARDELSTAISLDIFSVRDRLNNDPQFSLLRVETSARNAVDS
ncbi:MAG: hypothetical protein IT364_06320 [Candidatus Hydrogenedentes bacterium]|nr:hypothetical protein [Candidatus Hydrogenedentota bacterium]